MKFDKLVRDKIPETIQKKGKKVIFRRAENPEYWQKLVDKLQEEVDEFMSDQNIEELADVLEVLFAICDYKGIERDTLEATRAQKHRQKGGFVQKFILDEVID